MPSSVSSKEIANATIEEIQAWFDEGRLDAATLVLLCLERIGRFDRSGPTLNSVVEVNPDAYHIAQMLDQERRLRGPRSPLHGIPVLLKDNIATGDKMHTSAGSLAMKDVYAPGDSFVAERLRQAGAVILGKTNLTEWANFMTNHMPNGYSSRGGQVLNPYGPGHIDTGGSSSGSGAAIAAGLAVFAIGTETSGSILSPSTQNSLVGIKPTVGLVSRFGIVPISHSQDTAGPMARTVKDAAIALTALTGFDPRDPATGAGEGRVPLNFAEGLSPHALEGARLGVARAHFTEDLDPWEQSLLNRALKDLADLGAHVVDPADIESWVPEHRDYTVLTYEFKADLNAYLAWLGDRTPVLSLEDVIAYNEANADECLKYGQTQLLASNATSGTLTEPEYLEARARDLRVAAAEGIDAVMAVHRLDALLFVGNLGAGIAAKAGYPSITVPMGYGPDGQPLGLTFTARAFEEQKLIQFGYAYESKTHHRVPPELAKD
ncbi:amidase family protein [Sulfobacillus harzensis]|uniref:Amidase n=1 Tax=Sulfobacillus harzensis TaxID=2729629 RepID=A0A7Y0L3N7_9FIRM|nr:amidase family protein [Sulfobacillus harzensis]NMP22342.1 amidase [Sulfobacillus harzensis]